ncbi:MAG: WecB/TagA/CpsF family glycosyltransferase [Pseudomonadota bacterium]
MSQTSTDNDVQAKVDGWTVNIANQSHAIESIIEAASRAESFEVFTLNLDHLVKLRSDAAFREAYSRARFITADGRPVAALAARTDDRIELCAGSDMFVPLAKAAADAELPVYLFGTRDDVLETAEKKLAELTNSRIKVVGSAAPPMGFDPQGEAADEALDKIQASGARLCFVALGAPKQELFAARATERGINAGFICIGASIDFIVGEQVRAPAMFRQAGCEWIWRLGSNPTRLATRYAKCAFMRAELAFPEHLSGRILPHR